MVKNNKIFQKMENFGKKNDKIMTNYDKIVTNYDKTARRWQIAQDFGKNFGENADEFLLDKIC